MTGRGRPQFGSKVSREAEAVRSISGGMQADELTDINSEDSCPVRDSPKIRLMKNRRRRNY